MDELKIIYEAASLFATASIDAQASDWVPEQELKDDTAMAASSEVSTPDFILRYKEEHVLHCLGQPGSDVTHSHKHIAYCALAYAGLREVLAVTHLFPVLSPIETTPVQRIADVFSTYLAERGCGMMGSIGIKSKTYEERAHQAQLCFDVTMRAYLKEESKKNKLFQATNWSKHKVDNKVTKTFMEATPTKELSSYFVDVCSTFIKEWRAYQNYIKRYFSDVLESSSEDTARVRDEWNTFTRRCTLLDLTNLETNKWWRNLDIEPIQSCHYQWPFLGITFQSISPVTTRFVLQSKKTHTQATKKQLVEQHQKWTHLVENTKARAEEEVHSFVIRAWKKYISILFKNVEQCYKYPPQHAPQFRSIWAEFPVDVATSEVYTFVMNFPFDEAAPEWVHWTMWDDFCARHNLRISDNNEPPIDPRPPGEQKEIFPTIGDQPEERLKNLDASMSWVMRKGSINASLRFGVTCMKQIFDKLQQLLNISRLSPRFQHRVSRIMMQLMNVLMQLPEEILDEVRFSSLSALQKELDDKVISTRKICLNLQLDWWNLTRYRITAMVFQKLQIERKAREERQIPFSKIDEINFIRDKTARLINCEKENFFDWSRSGQHEFKKNWELDLASVLRLKESKVSILKSLAGILKVVVQTEITTEEEKCNHEDDNLKKESWFLLHSPKWRHIWNGIFVKYEDFVQKKWLALLARGVKETGLTFPAHLNSQLRWVPDDEGRHWSGQDFCQTVKKLITMCVWFNHLSIL